MLGVLGGAFGLLLAFLALRAFVASEPTTIPRIDLLGIDWRVAGFALGISVLTVAMFGLLPALRAASPDLRGAMQHLRAGAGPRSVRARRVAVSAQMAIAVLLLIGAGLLGRTIAGLMAVDLGFKAENVVSGRFALSPTVYPTLESWTTFHTTLLERARALPGVTAVGLNSAVPLEGGASESSIRKEGDPPSAPGEPGVMSMFQATSPGYFEAMGIQLVRGRPFDERDRDGSVPVAIVDETLAARMFAEQNPLGKRVSFEGLPPSTPGGRPGEVWREIVGVVRHVRHYGITANRPYVQIYTPYTQLPIYWRDRRPTMAIFAKTAGDPANSIPAVRQALGSMDARMPLYGVRTMEQYVSMATEQPRLSAALLVGFAGVALTLALVGIYGVLAYSVSQRQREIGVRMALGAGRPQIIRGVLWEGAKLSLIGLVVGLIAAVPAGRYIESLLYNVKPGDAWTFATAAAALFVTAMAATWLPAWRASTVEPVVALRGD
jgi:predicted permease